jgi:spore coat polysaccharide biosynthesis protein SpsF
MRVATLVTARLGSSRLPRKMLAPLHGRTVLEWVIERARLATQTDLLLLATTVEPEDDELAAAAIALGCTVFRGATHDVLVRWRDAARMHGVDLLVNCDGDDVFCDAVHVDRVVEEHRRSGAEYISCVGLPLGAAPLGVALNGLERVCDHKVDENTEGQGRFFAEPGLVARAEIAAPADLFLPEARMTLDYPEDLAFFGAVLAELSPAGEIPSLVEIVELLRSRPDIVALNSGLNEAYWQRFNALYGSVGHRSAGP